MPLEDQLLAAFVVPPYPHPLLVPEANPGYQRLRDAYGEVRAAIDRLQPDVLLLYSTQWLSVIGHQVQTRAAPEWVHVDQEWHELGSIPYRFRMDTAFGEAYVHAAQARGLEARAIDHHGFPIDTGSVVALKLLDPDRKHGASIVSCNMYADRSETVVLGKAARDAVEATGKRVVAIAVSAFSNRVFTDRLPFAEDRIHSLKDDEWNRKYLEFFQRGRLEDASQLARQFSAEANGDQRMKAIWWLNAVMGQHNDFTGALHAYGSVYGAGCAVVGMVPTPKATVEAEFDEGDPEHHEGDRNVLGGTNAFERAQGAGLRNVSAAGLPEDRDTYVATTKGQAPATAASARQEGPRAAPHARVEEGPAVTLPLSGRTTRQATPAPHAAPARATPAPPGPQAGIVQAPAAPTPVGAYPHARQVGDMLYLSGLGPRDPTDNSVPGGPVWDEQDQRQDYDIEAQTEAVVRNMKAVLAASGASIEDVVDVTCYLIDMKRDFPGFNRVYAKHFGDVQAARTTLEINRLPTPIAVELKVIAKAPSPA